MNTRTWSKWTSLREEMRPNRSEHLRNTRECSVNGVITRAKWVVKSSVTRLRDTRTPCCNRQLNTVMRPKWKTCWTRVRRSVRSTAMTVAGGCRSVSPRTRKFSTTQRLVARPTPVSPTRSTTRSTVPSNWSVVPPTIIISIVSNPTGWSSKSLRIDRRNWEG